MTLACVSPRVEAVDGGDNPDAPDNTCGTGKHLCGGQCVDSFSTNTCGDRCDPCFKPTGGTATCDGRNCGFTCQTGKICGNQCVFGCCNDADCMKPGETGKCDRATGNCNSMCADSKPCNGKCIPNDGCCTDVDCAAFACVMNACSKTECGPTGKKCNGGCIDGSACCPTAEDCLNGVDDDCDGNPDCADTDCQAATMCVPDPSDFKLTLQLNTDAANCAAPYAKSKTVLHLTPTSASTDCAGCSCTNPKADCRLKTVGVFFDADMCQAFTSYSVIEIAPEPEVGECFGVNSNDDPIGFVLERPDNQIERTCGSITGTPRPPGIKWAKDATFCEMDKSSRAGCPGGKVCVPRTNGQVCALATGTPGCPVGFNKSREIEWYQSADDMRTCVPATCACQAVGGSCPNQVSFGSSGSCDGLIPPLILPIPSKTCLPDRLHGPGFKLLGAYSPPVCSSINKVSGSLSGKNQHTLCCL
jgi:hypothetical protein